MSTAKNRRSVLVTGASGQIGGAVARALVAQGHRVWGLTRTPDSPAAEKLRNGGVVVLGGDLGDRASIARALNGADAVFAVTTPAGGTSLEPRNGIALINAARTARIRHFVYSSIGGADQKTDIPHFEGKRRIEHHLAASDLPWTVLGPTYLMENDTSREAMASFQAGTRARALPGGRRLQRIALANVAAFAAVAIDRREKLLGRRIDLASDDLSGVEEADVLSKLADRRISYEPTPIEKVRASSADEASFFDWLARVGFHADIAGLRRDHPEIGWLTYRDWARTQPQIAGAAATA